MSDFKPGDHVVHSVHGPATVVSVQMRDTPDGPVEYVKLQTDDMRIMIPTSELDEVGVREPIDAADAQEILELLGGKAKIDKTHSARRRRNAKRLTDGDPEALAKVVRSLRALREERDKALPMGDKAHLTDATDKLAHELSIALDISREEAAELVEGAFDDED